MGFISRQIEKMYKGVLFRRHDPDGSVFYFSERDFPGLVAEEFSFLSKRGHKLFGNFYHYGSPNKDRLIVFEHGMGNGHNGYFREIEALARTGYLVYSYDHTGCNKSQGEHIHGLSGSLSDLDDCINALTSQRGFREEQISIVGHSWGGFSSLNILSFHPCIHSIVAMSGFISIPIMQKQVIPFPISFYRKRLYGLEIATNPEYAERCAIDVLSKTDRPVLVIHSTDDATVSYKKNFLPLKSALEHKNNISFLTISGSGHNPHYTAEAFAKKEGFFKDLKKARRRGVLTDTESKKKFIDGYNWLEITEQNSLVWEKIFDFLIKH